MTIMTGLAYKPYVNQQSGLLELYLRDLEAAGRPSTTIKLRRDQLEHMRREFRKSVAYADEVTPELLLDWFASQKAWALETRRSYRSAVRSFFHWARTNGYLDSDPTAGLPRVAQRLGVPRPVPEDVYHAALTAASPKVALMMRLAAEAGLRRGGISRVHTVNGSP